MQKKKIWHLLLFELLLLGICLLTLVAFRIAAEMREEEVVPVPEESALSEVTFATKPGFYEKETAVFLSVPEDCTVYYTFTGEDPVLAMSSSKMYRYSPDTGIVLEAKEGKLSYYSLTVRPYYADGAWGDSVRSTYVVGEGVGERFNTLAVFITCDPDKLFGYEEGILVLGKTRADWLAANPGEKPISISPAGYNLRGWASEREVNVEFFDPAGNQLINQSVGVRPAGAYSRAAKLKSLKLYARKDYEEVNFRFDYPLYGEIYTEDGSGRLRLDYKRVLLRSTASDLSSGAQLRDELKHRAAALSGFPCTQTVAPCSVYINGEYYGCMWMHDVICDDFFEENYGYYPGVMGVVSGPEMDKPDKRYEIDSMEEDQYMYDDYNAMYNKYRVADMTDDAVYAEFCGVVDVENYLFYYAINTYINNMDWPYNNHKAYRYYTAVGEEYQPGTVFDGRWRFLVHDMDSRESAGSQLLPNYLLSKTERRRSELFQALMKRDECKEMYVSYCLEVMNGAFSTENYIALADSMHQERLAEATLYTTTSKYRVNSMKNIEEQMELIRTFAKERPATMISDLKKAFRFSGKTFKVHVMDPENGYVTQGMWEIDEDFSGTYITEYGVTFRAHPVVGYAFSHWTVNGEPVYTDDLAVSVDDAISGSVTVRAIFVRPEEENCRLVISTYSTVGNEDYLILYNPYDEPISTAGYQLSDNPNKLGKYTLPTMIVAPGESVTVYCDTYSGKEMLYHMCLPFGFKYGESVYFSYRYEILEALTFIDLHDGYRAERNMRDGKFYEVKAK
ncbi:MAG: hypothetical protein E7654_05580 [Ruminococcaceae bacterium]|nr:hypothetical protein [Oscillospiraceae bacterium]